MQFTLETSDSPNGLNGYCIVLCRVVVVALKTAGFGGVAYVRERCCPVGPVEVRLPLVASKPAVTFSLSLLLLFWTVGDLSVTGEAEVLFCVVLLGEVSWCCMSRMTDLRVWFSAASVWVCC